MKNIQVIDGAVNCAYDIFAATDSEFRLIFGQDEDIAFIDEVVSRHRKNKGTLTAALRRVWERPVAKRKAKGIHGTLFYELPEKKVFYPTRLEAEAVNPDGSRLRSVARSGRLLRQA